MDPACWRFWNYTWPEKTHHCRWSCYICIVWVKFERWLILDVCVKGEFRRARRKWLPKSFYTHDCDFLPRLRCRKKNLCAYFKLYYIIILTDWGPWTVSILLVCCVLNRTVFKDGLSRSTFVIFMKILRTVFSDFFCLVVYFCREWNSRRSNFDFWIVKLIPLIYFVIIIERILKCWRSKERY